MFLEVTTDVGKKLINVELELKEVWEAQNPNKNGCYLKLMGHKYDLYVHEPYLFFKSALQPLSANRFGTC